MLSDLINDVMYFLLQVTYTKVPWKFIIPSTCKKLVKSIRYRRYPYVAQTLLRRPQLKNATLAELERIIQAECSNLCKLKPTPSELQLLPKEKEAGRLQMGQGRDRIIREGTHIIWMEKEKLNLASLGW